MPCYDPRTTEIITSRSTDNVAFNQAIAKLKARLNLVTQLLCSACQTLERNEPDLIDKLGFSDWWKEHKAHDEAVKETKEETKEVSHGKKFHSIRNT